MTFRAGSGNRSVRSILNVQSIYLQDQVSIGDHWDLIAGARVDRFALDVENQLAGQRFERTDTLVSPRAGLIYKPVESASVYFSYARSFLPQSGDQFVSLDLSLAALEPERFNSYEVGAKWDILDNLSATVALYRLDRTNTRAAGPTPGLSC
ncbi:TonB-dependent receptor domain-containing protein [Hankyongella ginsenosidimutans]|uniref:TonB-dependent receptor domain-containing protein n=1 Tax=Hankyongella ginsenosidimutans TaxID=1763828 RepID=UPI001CA33A08|nr:TonB-dependent receptor [Hankyongella ginsenosidimutans]